MLRHVLFILIIGAIKKTHQVTALLFAYGTRMAEKIKVSGDPTKLTVDVNVVYQWTELNNLCLMQTQSNI